MLYSTMPDFTWELGKPKDLPFVVRFSRSLNLEVRG